MKTDSLLIERDFIQEGELPGITVLKVYVFLLIDHIGIKDDLKADLEVFRVIAV